MYLHVRFEACPRSLLPICSQLLCGIPLVPRRSTSDEEFHPVSPIAVVYAFESWWTSLREAISHEYPC
ncbi:unnamed protein product [Linum tenue]|uniref:Uncharacterized protein n=1 Tax=Linum tenue TaxID=586396 RepID=A0AAV0L5I8_9ROSI|nr:unnamed protein product [Linum tenue]